MGNDTISGGGGDDLATGGAGDDTLSGGCGNDRPFGSADADTVLGGDGDDVLRGFIGSDVLDGGRGNDNVGGEDGDDVIRGGEGSDFLRGGGGNDVFRVDADHGDDEITDFVPGSDLLDLRAFGFADGVAVRALGSIVGGRLVVDLPGTGTVTLLTLTAADQLIDASLIL